MSLSVGAKLGPYIVEAPLGAGGMGEVYRARDMRLDRPVAIKVLAAALSTDPRFHERFEREARVIASLNHPQICTLHDVGTHERSSFLVMEYLEGETLAARLRRERPTMDVVIKWALDIAGALEFAHTRGIVHRDLKPANLFVTASGGIKVLDFGLAKTARLAPETLAPTVGETDVGVAVGTIAYMSPEQARGEPVDARSDVFSFGAVIYEALTGQSAFGGTTTAVIFDAILNRPVRSLVGGSNVSGELAVVVERMLAKRPEDRYPNGGAVAAALRVIGTTRDASRSSGSTPAKMPSLGVLPFADMSAHKDQDYFCEGMAEELINALAKLSGLRVASRTSSFRFKGADDVHKIGHELGVDTILEGSVRTAGTRLRVSAQLVNVADGYQLWSERFDRQLDDVFEIQDQIARAIVDALKIKLLAASDVPIVKRAAENVEAYQLCLKARHYWHRWTPEGFQKAFELFQDALHHDPNCALAHFGVGDCHMAAGSTGLWPIESIATARTLFEEAVRLDPDLAEAHAILGVGQGMCGGWDWAAAERSFTTAIRLNPQSAHAKSAYAMHLMITSRMREAVAMAREAVMLDPLMPSWHAFEVVVQYAARQYHDAVRTAAMATDLHGSMYWPLSMSALSHLELGDAVDAITALEEAAQSGMPYLTGWLGFGLARVGRRQEAEQKRRELISRGERPVAIACIATGLGDREDALDWLEQAVAVRDPMLAHHMAYPLLDGLRSDPRFVAIRGRLGL